MNKEKDLVELRIDGLGTSGEGVGRYEGFTLFVEGALPGERVLAEVYERRKTYGRARVVKCTSLESQPFRAGSRRDSDRPKSLAYEESPSTRKEFFKFLEKSPHRVEPICPLFGRCGGCQLMHLDYAQQLEVKRQRVVDALQRIGKFADAEVKPCIASPALLNYRNKIQLPVNSAGKLGLYARNTHEIIEVEQCYIHSTLGERVFQKVQQLLREIPIKNLRHVLIKSAVKTERVLVVLVTQDETPPARFAEALISAMTEIKGVVQNINSAPGNVVLSRKFRTLAGQGWIEDELSGLKFKVSPASFFQVNPAQAEQLYAKVLEFAELSGKERVLDAYCGVGTLSLILAQQAKEVIGVECVTDAIHDAQENAAHNQITNAQFVCAQAEEFISRSKDVDAAVLNPPRKGCERFFLEKLAELHPKRIVYVSCDPATLARDLQLLCSKGYRLGEVQPYDMFPQTAHVETITVLTIP